MSWTPPPGGVDEDRWTVMADSERNESCVAGAWSGPDPGPGRSHLPRYARCSWYARLPRFARDDRPPSPPDERGIFDLIDFQRSRRPPLMSAARMVRVNR